MRARILQLIGVAGILALAAGLAVYAYTRGGKTSGAGAPMLKGALTMLRPMHLKTLALCTSNGVATEETGVYYHCAGTRAGYEASVDLTRDTVMLRALFMWHVAADAFADSIFEARRRHYRDRLGDERRCAQYHYTWKVGDSVHVAVARTQASASQVDSSGGRVIELLDVRPLPAYLEC